MWTLLTTFGSRKKLMDLRSGNAFWPIKNGLLASYPALKS